MGNYFQNCIFYLVVVLPSPDLIAAEKTPFSNYFKPCNPKSIKPINYKNSNIIIAELYYASIKGKGLKQLVCTLSPHKQKIRIEGKL